MSHLRVAIHLHTNYSPDGNIDPAQLLDAAEREGIDCVAITDHDEVRGALEAQRWSDRVRVIVGEEISTTEGHLLGLFLRGWIAPGRSALETIAEIRAQGGLVLAPHPFASLCEDSLGSRTESLVGHLDAIEVHNAQNPLAWQDRRAALFALRHGLPGFAGCDTHLTGRLAPAYQHMADCDGPQSFLNSLRDAELHFGRVSLAYLARMAGRHLWQRTLGLPLAGYGTNAREEYRYGGHGFWARRQARPQAQAATPRGDAPVQP